MKTARSSNGGGRIIRGAYYRYSESSKLGLGLYRSFRCVVNATVEEHSWYTDVGMGDGCCSGIMGIDNG